MKHKLKEKNVMKTHKNAIKISWAFPFKLLFDNLREEILLYFQFVALNFSNFQCFRFFQSNRKELCIFWDHDI
jgi:hypothetical protein